jgi:hypothetical protein
MTAPHLVDGVWVADCARCGITLPTAELDYVRSEIDVASHQWIPGGIVCMDVTFCALRSGGDHR